MFSLKQRMGAWLILIRNPLLSQPDCRSNKINITSMDGESCHSNRSSSCLHLLPPDDLNAELTVSPGRWHPSALSAATAALSPLSPRSTTHALHITHYTLHIHTHCPVSSKGADLISRAWRMTYDSQIPLQSYVIIPYPNHLKMHKMCKKKIFTNYVVSQHSKEKTDLQKC